MGITQNLNIKVMNNNELEPKIIFTTKEENGLSDMNRAFQNLEKICNHYGFTIQDIKIVKIEEAQEIEKL